MIRRKRLGKGGGGGKGFTCAVRSSGEHDLLQALRRAGPSPCIVTARAGQPVARCGRRPWVAVVLVGVDEDGGVAEAGRRLGPGGLHGDKG